MNKNTFL